MSTVQDDSRPIALLVDDDAILRMDIAEMLASAGFRTLEAEDGDAAMAVLEQRHRDVTLLFSDVEMPGSRDGFALAREVAVKWPAIAMVIASGRLVPGGTDLPKGAHFICKPFSADAVREHLREALPDHRKPAALLG